MPTIWEASLTGDVAALSDIVRSGASVNKENPELESPLHLAVESGSTSACALLLQHGACVQAINRKLETPLHLAAAASKQDIVRLLLEAGANSLERNADGHNVFQVAVDEDTRSILVRANDCVECDAGCGMIIQHRLLQRHVRTDCPFRSIACPQCATQLRAHTVPMHLDTECLFSRVPCPLLCGALVYRFDVLTHVTTACTERHQLYDPPESSSVADMLEWGMDDLVDAFGEVLLRDQPIVAAAPSEGKTATDDREDAVSAIARVFVTETGTGVARTPPIPPPDARPDGRAQARPSVSHWDAEPIQHAAFVWGSPSASVLQLCDWMSAWANMHDLQPAHFLQAVAGGVRHFQVLMAAAQADGVTDSAGIVRDCTPMLSGRHVRDILRVGLRTDGATAHASLTHEELIGLSLAPVNPSAEAAIDAAVMEATNAALTMRAHVEQHVKVLLLLCGAPAAVRDKLAAWLCETHLPRVEALLRASQHADVDTLAEVHTLCCVPIAVTSRVTATAPLEAGDVRVVGHVHIPLGCEANALRSLRPRIQAQISPSIEGSNGAGDEAWNFVDLLQGGSLVLADAEREFCAWDCGPLLVVRLHDSLAT